MKKYRRAIALFLAIGLMVLIPSGMGVSASGNTVEAKMSENIAQVLSMTGIEREEYSDQQVIDVDGQRVRQLVFDDNLKFLIWTRIMTLSDLKNLTMTIGVLPG